MQAKQPEMLPLLSKGKEMLCSPTCKLLLSCCQRASRLVTTMFFFITLNTEKQFQVNIPKHSKQKPSKIFLMCVFLVYSGVSKKNYLFRFYLF